MSLAKQFRQQIDDSFDSAELRLLARDIGIDWDELEGFRKSSKIDSLIGHAHRRGKTHDLLVAVREDRGHIDWPDAT